MKKFMTIVLTAAMVFAVAGAVQATTLETSGEFRARLWYLDNYLVDGESSEFWDQRLRLGLVWPVADGVKVVARADIMEGNWGDNVVRSTVVPGTDTTPAVIRYDTTSNARQPISWDQVYGMFNVPGTPATVTVGRQPAAWGTGVFVAADNRDRFKLTAKFGEITALYTYDKYTEIGQLHGSAGLDDRTQHSIGAIGKFMGWNTGVIYGLIQDGSAAEHDVTLHAASVYAMGQAGPVGVKGEFVYGWGEDDHNDIPDQDLSGILAYLGLSMPAGPVTVGLEGVYAQGNDPGTNDNEGALRCDYQAPFWSVILFNNMDYQGYDSQNDITKDAGVTNAMAGKLSVTAMPMSGLTLYGAVVYAARDEVPAGVDDQLGTEIDLVATYAITENVSWTVGGGFLMAGDFYGDVDDPWGAVSAFTFKF